MENINRETAEASLILHSMKTRKQDLHSISLGAEATSAIVLRDEDEDVDVMETDDEDSRDATNLLHIASSDCEDEPELRKKHRKKRTIADYAAHGIDPSKLEESVEEVTNRFKLGCECMDSNCFSGLSAELVYRHRLNIAELTKAEQDMYLMGVTMASLTNPETTVKQKERQRLRAQYVYHGKKVCLDAFLYLENCTHYQLKRIRKHVMTHGVVPRIHGNQGKKPHNTFSLDIYRHANSFIENYIESFATQVTSQSKGKGSKKSTITLPQKVTRKTLHNEYKEYCAKIDGGAKVMGYSSFRHFITEQFPNIRFTKSEVGIPRPMNPELYGSKAGSEMRDQQLTTASNIGATTVQVQQAPTTVVQPTLFVDGSGNTSFAASSGGNTFLITQVLPADEPEEESETELTLKDVADVMRGRYAIITGGKSRDGHPIITFTDVGNFHLLEDHDYRRLMVYLSSVPSMHEADVGFVLVIDRRKDKWHSVKTVLLRISEFFPGLIHIAYILQPAGFLQKAISEVSNKLFKDEFKFQIQICNTIEDLFQYIDPSQLTLDLSGTLVYNHKEWIQQRFALEKFSAVTHGVSRQLHLFTQKIREAGFPNDVASTKITVSKQEFEYSELKGRILNAAKHGEDLLADIRQSPHTQSVSGDADQTEYDAFPDRITNSSAVERLLVQLEETERTFDDFWQSHFIKLNQCLELRQFEQDFRELRARFDDHLYVINHMTEIGDSIERIDHLIKEAALFQEKCLIDIDRADELQGIGTELMSFRHYGMDSIRPKCIELCRMTENLTERQERRVNYLNKCRDLQLMIADANEWCTRGIEILAQPVEKCASPEHAEEALTQLDEFKAAGEKWGASDSAELKTSFHDVITPETKALVQQVISRVADVLIMCEKRQESLKKLAVKPLPKLVQQVNPEPAIPLPRPHLNSNNHRSLSSKTNVLKKNVNANKQHGVASQQTTEAWPDSSSPDSEASNHDNEVLRVKRGHVLAELLETERIYVREMATILRGYKDELHKAEREGRAPIQLSKKADVIFGNLEDLHKFHNEIFLIDLENCITTPELVGLCFYQRRDSFHRLYSLYCQNIPGSEALRQAAEEQNCNFFRECQLKLDQKLPLGAYLLKPVQRITKYQLLLKDLLKYSEDLPKSLPDLQSALDCMLVVLKCINDSMHQVAITGFWGNLMEQGELLMQGQFSVWMENKKDRLRELRLKPMQRQIFLYEKSVLFCKRVGRDPETATYQFKTFLQMSQVGLTENLHGSKGDQRKLELWLQGRQEVYIVQAPTLQQKDEFVKAIKQVLFSQLEQLKGDAQKKLQRGLSQAVLARNKPLRQTASWDSQVGNPMACVAPPVPNATTVIIPVHGDRRRSSRHLSSEAGAAEREDDEVGWSSDYSNSDEDSNQDPFPAENADTTARKYVALADYCAMGSSEVTMHEGDIIELLKVGCAGWWFVKLAGNQQEGWAPSAYLEVAGTKKMSRQSSLSVSSQDSGVGTNGRFNQH